MKGSVLLVGNFLSASLGIRSVCEDLAGRLTKSDWSVFTTSKRPGRAARLLDMISTAWGRRHEYTVAQLDVFSGLAFVWAEAVCLVLRLAGKPYILTLHGGNLPAFAQRWPRRVSRLLHSAAAVTTPSRYLQEQMSPYRTDLRLLPNALDLNAYRFRLREQPKARIVWLRAFHSIYNPSLAAKIVALLAGDFPDICLAMAGPDKEDGSLEHLQQSVANLGATPRIDVHGRVPKADVPNWLNKADIFLNTSEMDNTPVSVLEAMACGLCVVSTNVGGIPYLLEHEHDALLVPPDDPEAMAIAVRRLLTEPGLARYLSKNAREKAEQFDWSNTLPKWEALLTLAIKKGVSKSRYGSS